MSRRVGEAQEEPEDGFHNKRSKGPARKLRLAVVCSSNQNRSMEAHALLQRHQFNIKSFGSGKKVKLPGPGPDKPNVYDFGGPTYKEMYEQLLEQDPRLYRENGILGLLERNQRIKEKPERFQDAKDEFDVILTCEGRVFEQVVQGLEEKGTRHNKPVHVVNFEIKDNEESATIGALHIHEFCEALEKRADDLDEEIDGTIKAVEDANHISLLHSVAFY
eukprot:m.246974 g.246974  ORF g.246974 m.246974 type:complete len:219 (-) comp54479_c0_seq3:1734-2390(-)